MTNYIAAYDTESPKCLEAVRRIVEVHEKFEMPATFFIVARLLENRGEAYLELLGDNPLFEIGSHTYSHALLRENVFCGAPVAGEKHRREVVESKSRIEQLFEREISGFRPAVGFAEGLRGAPNLLGLCREGGYGYISCKAWSPGDTLPAPVEEAFTYEEEGFPDLWEIPPCGWHENVMKGHNLKPDLERLQEGGPVYPGTELKRHIETVEEEVAINRIFIDRAMETGTRHVSLIWHPWSLFKFDPEMSMLEKVFGYVRDAGLPCRTFAEHCRILQEETRAVTV
jgi:hypothetical protein